MKNNDESITVLQDVGEDNENDQTIGLDTYGYPDVRIYNGNVEVTLGWFMPFDREGEPAWYLMTEINTNYQKYLLELSSE